MWQPGAAGSASSSCRCHVVDVKRHVVVKRVLPPASMSSVRLPADGVTGSNYIVIPDFPRLRASDGIFVDTTRVIAELEESRQSFPNTVVIGEPRTGKTMLCSVLMCYYDVAQTDTFMELFDGLYIGAHPTPSANTYHVLHLPLSIMAVEGRGVRMELAQFDVQVNECCAAFRKDYDLDFDISDLCTITLVNLARAVGAQTETRKLFIVVDEYDRLPNAIMFSKPAQYLRELRSDSRRGDADEEKLLPLRRLYSVFKDLSDNASRFKLLGFRSFTTGLTPLALADASVFNIGDYLTTHPMFSSVFRFSGATVKALIARLPGLSINDRDLVYKVIARYYNGLSFYSDSSGALFQPYLCVTQLANIQHDRFFRERFLSAVRADNVPVLNELMANVNVEASQSAVQFLVKHALSALPFTYEDLVAADASVPTALVMAPFRSADLFTSDVAPCGARGIDRVRLFLVYYGLLTCGRKHEKGVDGVTRLFYAVRPGNLVAQAAGRPLQNALGAMRDDILSLVQPGGPDPKTVAGFFQRVVTSPVLEARTMRVAEIGLQNAILKWVQSWRESTGRQDIQETAEEIVLYGGQRLRCDLLIRNDAVGSGFLMELKAVPVSCIDWDTWKESQGRGVLTAMRDYLKMDGRDVFIPVEKVCGLPLTASYALSETMEEWLRADSFRSEKQLTVGDVARCAMQQLGRHEQGLVSSFKELHAYVILQVHNRVFTFPLDSGGLTVDPDL